MKAIFVVSLATILVAFVAATSLPECPSENGEEVTLLPNPDDCKTYYACDNGIPFLMHCNEGLHFNPELKVCDWPENVICKPSEPETTESSEETSTLAKITVEDEESEEYIDTEF